MELLMRTDTTSATNKASNTQRTDYINSPLTIAIEGMKILFQKAPTVAIALAILSALGATNYVLGQPPATNESSPAAAGLDLDPVMIILIIIFVVVVALGVLIVGSIITGIAAYTAAELAKGHDVHFKQAVKATFARLWSFIWLQVLTAAKVILWSLLFIIPGIIMAVRYSLANVSFFDSDKKLTGNAAIKDSLALTKGAWVTTFGAQVFFNIITFGLISPIADTGSKAVLYRQLSASQQADTPKPKPHVLSLIALGLFVLVGVIAIGALAYAIANYGLSSIK